MNSFKTKANVQIIATIILFIIIYQLCIFFYYSTRFIHKHFILKGKNLEKLYGKNSWVIITGASSGQGKYFACEMAKRNFNLLLIGSKRTVNTIDIIKTINSNCLVEFIEKDFRKASEPTFFTDIEAKINTIGNISGLINNVAYRTAWNPYHESPKQTINDSIIVGTIVQSQLTRIAIKNFLLRSNPSFIINITAQCIFPTFGLGEILDNHISVPYLSVYEAANAFGFYQGNSIYKEYKHKKYNGKIHIMNVMPGAVVTENTGYLSNTIFNVKAEDFVKNIITQLGTYQGNVYGYWGHEFSPVLVNLFPIAKNMILEKVGLNISSEFMSKPTKQY